MSRNRKIMVGVLVVGVVALMAVGAWALFIFLSRSGAGLALNNNTATSDPATLALTAQAAATQLAATSAPNASVTTAPGATTQAATTPIVDATTTGAPGATSAPSAIGTGTSPPAATGTSALAATNSPVPPTATGTTAPLAGTPSSTATSIPAATATSTSTSTPTNTPSSTPTNTPTNTAVPFAVTSVTASVSPSSNNGCPDTFNFSGQITANGAGAVTYVWDRSDGAGAPHQSLVFSGPGTQAVNGETWTIGASGPHWERLRIISPGTLTSNQAAFTVTCFSGFWNDNFGTMSLSQNGNNVNGSYVNSILGSNGTVAGTVTGNTLNGQYNISGDSNSIQWTIAGGGQTFNGNFSGGAGKWCGARSGVNFPAGCGFAGTWNATVGTSAGSLNLTQNGNSVSGTYFNGSASGTIDGSISYSGGQAVLTGNWHLSPSSSGPIKFYLFGYDDVQFNGNYNSTFAWCGWRGGAAQPATCHR